MMRISFKTILSTAFLFTVWIVVWLTYGDVLHEIQMQDFWISGPRELYITVTKDAGILSYLCHGAVTVFVYPWLGALEIACMAYILACLTDALFRPGDRYAALAYIPSVAFLALCFNFGCDIYIKTGNILPFEMFFVTATVLLAGCTVRLFFKKGTGKQASGKCMAINASALALAVLGCVVFGYRNPQFRELAKIRYLTDTGQTEKAADFAEKSSAPTHSLAAYHAMAVADLGQLGDRLFKMSYDFKPFRFSDIKRAEGNIYSADITLKSGMVLTAYHLGMEQMVTCGVTKRRLEFMTKCAVLNGERQLAEKYLSVLSRMPFEKAFVEKYRDMAAHPELIAEDREFAAILKLKPESDHFERGSDIYQFLRYLADLGREDAAELSAAACLYMKDIDRFKAYLWCYRGKKLPESFQQVTVMLTMIDGNSLLKQFSIDLETLNEVNGFTSALMEHSTDPDGGKAALKEKYERTYMYYESFANKAQ